MTCYRISERADGQFEPQVWRWWFPFWMPMQTIVYEGCGWCPASFDSMGEAVNAIRYRQRKEQKPIYHSIDIGSFPETDQTTTPMPKVKPPLARWRKW